MSSIEGIEDPFGTKPAGGTSLLEREETQLSEPGDHERFSHYVRKEKIMVSRFAPCAVKSGLPGVTRRSSRSAPPAKKFMRVLSPVKTVAIMAATTSRS